MNRRRRRHADPACPIALTATPGYDPALASRFRDDATCDFVHCRVLCGISVSDLSRESGVPIVHLHRIEAGEVRPNAAGWARLDQALDRLSARRAA